MSFTVRGRSKDILSLQYDKDILSVHKSVTSCVGQLVVWSVECKVF